MKRILLNLIAALATFTTSTQTSILLAQGTAFTYQGQLNSGVDTANGSYDLMFTLFDASSAGNIIAGPVTNSAVGVTNGLFATTLDLGANFPGTDRWLEIAVRSNLIGTFTSLSPRQKLTPTPYAITALDVTSGNIARLNVPNTALQATAHPIVTSGFITDAVVDNAGLGYTTAPTVTVNPNGSGSGAVITATISAGSVSALTVLNAGSGYTGNATLTIGAPPPNNFQVFVTSNYFPNVNVFSNASNIFVGRFAGDAEGLTNLNVNASGGQTLTLRMNGSPAFRIEPNTNGAVNVIAGAAINLAGLGVAGATISGGGTTNYFGTALTNSARSDFSTIGGGVGNSVQLNSFAGTIGGGFRNAVGNTYGTVAGGYQNVASGSSAFVGGGVGNAATNDLATVAGGSGNAAKYQAAVGGGANNTASGTAAVVGGGSGNAATGQNATVSGGNGNVASNLNATVSGGVNNVAGGFSATIPGGVGNIATGADSFAAGKGAQALHDGSFVWNDVTIGAFSSTAANQFLIRAAGGVGIGTASPGAQLEVRTAAASGNAIRFGYSAGGSGNLIAGPSRVSIATDDMVERFVIRQGSGNVGIGLTVPNYQLQLAADSAAKPNGGSWANSSDARLKRNITPLTNALERLTRLRGVNFEWMNPEDHANQQGPQGGFIAQEVEKVFPNWVTEVGAAEHDRALTPDGKNKSLTLPFEFDALVVEAIKEQQAQIKSRDDEIQELKQRLSALEQKLSQLKPNGEVARSENAP